MVIKLSIPKKAPVPSSIIVELHFKASVALRNILFRIKSINNIIRVFVNKINSNDVKLLSGPVDIIHAHLIESRFVHDKLLNIALKSARLLAISDIYVFDNED